MSEFVLFLLIGRLLTWFLQTNGLLESVWKFHPKLAELGECDLCLGFWVFLLMSTLIQRKFEKSDYPAWFNVIVHAAFSAFVTHIMRLGWQSKFQITVV